MAVRDVPAGAHFRGNAARIDEGAWNGDLDSAAALGMALPSDLKAITVTQVATKSSK
ncbi:MAG: hypothetical protein QOG72_1165 [Sphingomonadales bacterium]|jgi:hypothetical protein|nr:hypothetical protein [Sphingomonadales bacterium]